MISPLKIKSFSASVRMHPCLVTKLALPVFNGPCLEIYYLDNIKSKPVL